MTNLINKSQIMKNAWTMFKAEQEAVKGTWTIDLKTWKKSPSKPRPFATFLKVAWAQAKHVDIKVLWPTMSTQEKLDWVNRKIFMHNTKDLFNSKDWAYSRKLQNEKIRLMKELAA